MPTTTIHGANGGWEYTAFLAVACGALFLLGEDGAFALSRWTGIRPGRQSSTA